jgi:hypothetical protein
MSPPRWFLSSLSKRVSMMWSTRAIVVVGSCMLSMVAIAAMHAADEAKPDEALARTRKTVRMLDDIYKTAVVLITDKYVNDEKDFPAGSAAIALFDAIKNKEWHEVRLLDASGEPYDDDNVAKDAFEKEAIAQLKAGKGYYDVVEQRDGQRYLRAATPIPVVMDKCVLCHENYKAVKKGQPIGALSYTIRIE